MTATRKALADVTNKRRAVLNKLKRMRPSGPPKKYLETKSKVTTANDAKQPKRTKGELQQLKSEMNTPPREPGGQQRSPPSGCLRRREKKSRSRAALLESLDENENQILQRLDFTGCSDDEVHGEDAQDDEVHGEDAQDDEVHGEDAQDENVVSSFLNVETETSPPVTLKRKLPQPNEPYAAAKRKRSSLRALTRKVESKCTTAAAEAVDMAIVQLTRSGEQPKVPIRNTCVLDSPSGDKQDRKAKRSTSRKNKASIDKHAEANKEKAAKKPASTLVVSRLCSLQRMFGGD